MHEGTWDSRHAGREAHEAKEHVRHEAREAHEARDHVGHKLRKIREHIEQESRQDTRHVRHESMWGKRHVEHKHTRTRNLADSSETFGFIEIVMKPHYKKALYCCSLSLRKEIQNKERMYTISGKNWHNSYLLNNELSYSAIRRDWRACSCPFFF